jgi:phosphoribosylanthranilate isomerase
MFLFHKNQSPELPDNKTKVKICGIRKVENAEIAVRAGADLLGFNFINTSHSYVNPITAKEIIEKVHKHVQVVGVFKDVTVEEINELAHYLKLHMVQLHGEENPDFIARIKVKVIKKVKLTTDFSLENTIPALQNYNAQHIVLDHSYPDDYEHAHEIASQLPIFLRGLTPENVAQAVVHISPFGVDASTGVEVNGHEHPERIASFITHAKAASK